jgi:hypothetical protein
VAGVGARHERNLGSFRVETTGASFASSVQPRPPQYGPLIGETRTKAASVPIPQGSQRVAGGRRPPVWFRHIASILKRCQSQSRSEPSASGIPSGCDPRRASASGGIRTPCETGLSGGHLASPLPPRMTGKRSTANDAACHVASASKAHGGMSCRFATSPGWPGTLRPTFRHELAVVTGQLNNRFVTRGKFKARENGKCSDSSQWFWY